MKTLHRSIIIGITLASITIFSFLFIAQPVKPSSIYITGIHTDKGYAYQDESTHKTNMPSGGIMDSSIHISKGTMVALHFTNKDGDTGSTMDLNIDAFNVHTKPLTYFQAQTITFLANQDGTFTYYSNLHPEMNGTITVDHRINFRR